MLSIDEMDHNGYGPGPQYIIDTTKPFHVRVDIVKDNE